MKKFSIALLPLVLAGSFIMNNVGNINDGPEMQLDGPYVSYSADKVYAKYIVLNQGVKTVKIDSVSANQKDSLSLKVATDDPNEFFTVRLQKKLQNQKSDYKKADRQLVVSDIEGNFTAFKKLLQANGVIDASYRWTFGDGHLVTIGDFFDRGDQVTEVLWLIYSLEEQAAAAGGYVHFVLGNHEIMNLSDDLRYLNTKYKETAQLMNIAYMSLYDENSELGRWLRTKNIIEKIGKMLFMHAGISEPINQMDASLNQINQLARPYYGDTIYDYKNPKSDTIMGNDGPFWYRGYYSKSKPALAEQVDQTLSKFSVKHIVTGHSLVADTVSLWYNGKVINTDTHHAKGHSEALLVEGDKFYRVNASGQKVLIMER
jgi:hypothetical protein